MMDTKEDQKAGYATAHMYKSSPRHAPEATGPYWKPTFVEWATLVKYCEYINKLINACHVSYIAYSVHVASRVHSQLLSRAIMNISSISWHQGRR